eukprot:42528-Eustigmatos_ZCMA.PRE.1
MMRSTRGHHVFDLLHDLVRNVFPAHISPRLLMQCQRDYPACNVSVLLPRSSSRSSTTAVPRVVLGSDCPPPYQTPTYKIIS